MFSDSVGELLNEFVEDSNDNWEWKHIETKGPPNIMKKPFAVKLFVYFKKNGPLKNASFKYAEACFKKIPVLKYCTKATVGISINVPSSNTQIIVMGSHLPVSTKTNDMGYTKRAKAVKLSIEMVYSQLLTPSENTIVLWGGDMNYRRNTPISETGPIVEEQLTYALNDNVFNIESGKFSEHVLEFPPTCKFRYCKNGVCPTCRSTSDEDSLSDNEYDYSESESFSESDFDEDDGGIYTDYMSGGNDNCYDDSRIPSYCDRILYFTKGDMILTPIRYKSWSKSKSVQTSDHNLVWADFILSL
jgi:Endonuclease/Exonuclease/phosphatase family 2